MTKSIEIPDIFYPKEPILVCPSSPTPNHTLQLSNLDEQKFLRFSIKYLYLFRKALLGEALRASLAKLLVDYYPFAGRLRACGVGEGEGDGVGEGEKLEVECNGEGAVFAEGFVDLTAGEFLDGSGKPNRSWRKLLYRVEAQSFVGIPPLVIQVTHLRCGGMILCTAISHCLCDGVGSAQFLHAWAHITAKPNSALPTAPFHDRHMMKPRIPPQITFSHPEFNPHPSNDPSFDLLTQLLSQPLSPVSLTFNPSHILHLKKQCIPSLKCTSFEVLASHVWRSWVKSLELPSALRTKLLFSINVRKKVKPEPPRGFYGNAFVLGCAETSVKELVTSNAHYGVKLVQEAKECVNNDYVRSMIDLLEEKRGKPDLSVSLVISPWSKLGLEDLDFGEGRPLHMGTLASEIYCLFLPVIGDLHSFNVLISVPQSSAERFEHYCLKGLDGRGENKEEHYCLKGLDGRGENKEDVEKVNGGRGYRMEL